jgi:hypothetical protein
MKGYDEIADWWVLMLRQILVVAALTLVASVLADTARRQKLDVAEA